MEEELAQAIFTHDREYVEQYLQQHTISEPIRNVLIEFAHDALADAYDHYDAPAVGFELFSSLAYVGLSTYLMKLQLNRLFGDQIVYNSKLITQIGATALFSLGFASGLITTTYFMCVLKQVVTQKAYLFKSKERVIFQAKKIVRAQKILHLLENSEQ